MNLSFCVCVTLLLAEPDPRSIPADERIAYVNKLTRPGEGPNAAPLYEEAVQKIVTVFDLSMRLPFDADRSGYDRVWKNDALLVLAEQWSGPDSKIIREWLSANAASLDLIRRASDADLFHRPLSADHGRLHEALSDPGLTTGLNQLYKLAAMNANEHAMRGEWTAAYEWTQRCYRMARHAYQPPYTMLRLTGLAIERRASEQALAFMRREFPTAPQALLADLRDARQALDAQQQVTQVEQMLTLDYIEAMHAWARKPSVDPKLGEFVRFALEDSLMQDVGQATGQAAGDGRFKSVAEFQEQIKATSVDDEWAVFQQTLTLDTRYGELHFSELWPRIEEFRREYDSLARRSPTLWFFRSMPLFPPGQFSYLTEVPRAYRLAVEAVISLHEYRAKHGKLPKYLVDLAPDFVRAAPVDPFSGRPLVYRLTPDKKDFVLYSVGENQVDDGGKHDPAPNSKGDLVFWPPPTSAP